MNECITKMQNNVKRRKAHVVAILKPGKGTKDEKNK